ncbi:MAG: hypothetical protein F6K55_06205 [Moorea sp. SIO4A3]|nr:hypothetical protein [Moorena sp. SIO4A3]
MLTETKKKDGAPTPKANVQGRPRGDDLAREIVDEAKRQGITQLEQIAYILATAQHESNMGQYWEEIADGTAYDGRADLGNTLPGDGPRYKGMGLVHITGRRNYALVGDKLGIPLLEKPELAKEPKYALVILTKGMVEGWFTGRTLDRYIKPGLVDYVGARRIVNGTDRAQKIAGHARQWEARLRAGEFAVGKSSSPVAANKVSSVVPPVLKGQGIRIKIGIGFTGTELVTFEYFMTGIRTSANNSTRITGKQLRFMLGKEPRLSKIYQGLTLRQAAKLLQRETQIKIDIPRGETRVSEVINFNRNTYQNLLEVAQQSGFVVRGSTDKIKIQPITFGDKILEVKRNQLLSGSYWGDEATSNRLIKGKVLTDSLVSQETTDEILDEINQLAAGIQPIKSVIDEGKGIGKGFLGRLVIDPYRTPEILTIKPGDLVKFSKEFVYSSAMQRNYRISEVGHSPGASVLDIYLPVAVKGRPKKKAITGGKKGVSKVARELPPQWKVPLKKGDTVAGFRVTSPYGLRVHPLSGRRKMHWGVDIGAQTGTPLYVIGDQITLKRFFDHAGGGNVARFEWAGITFDYLHCAEIAREGVYKAGAQIATVGNTHGLPGVTMYPHLHFQQRYTNEFSEKVSPFKGYVYWALTGKPPV